jgi:hypothetical protein
MTYDLCVTLFPRDDVQLVRTDKMMILYVAVRWIKISLLQAMIRQWLTNFKMTGSIKCMFLISLTISNLGITQGPNVPSIANPRTQGHILKKGSYSHDQDHVHNHYMLNFYTRSWHPSFHPFPIYSTNNAPRIFP